MKRHKRRAGFVVPMAVMAMVAVGLLIPAINAARMAARRQACQTKMKDLVLAANLYECKFKRLPPSCHVARKQLGSEEMSKDGYSFLVDMLPEIEQEWLYKRMNVVSQLDKENDNDNNNLPDECLARALPIFLCPDARNHRYVDRHALPEKRQAITNYKAVSASTRKAYELSSQENPGENAEDIYGIGNMEEASDGVIYVGSRTRLGSISDGMTNTFLLAETEEPVYSRWIVGQECGLYTMTDDAVFSPATSEITFVHPEGYTRGKFGSDSTIPAAMRKTNLNRDYAASPYPWGEDGFASRRYSGKPVADSPKRRGPGANHDGVVMHAYVGGAADTVSTEIDVAAYFFLTTRSNGDPSPFPEAPTG